MVMAGEGHIPKVHPFSSCVLFENGFMVAVQRSPKCQCFNSSQYSKEKTFFREERNKGEKKIKSNILRKCLLNEQRQGSQPEPMLLPHFENST